MLNSCHRCDGQVHRHTGTISGSCLVLDSNAVADHCTNDKEVADALALNPTTPLVCVTTFIHSSDPRKAIESKVERRCAIRSPFHSEGCPSQADKRTVKGHDEISMTCQCSSTDGCNTHRWNAREMLNTNPFTLSPGTWTSAVTSGMASRSRTCHVCSESRSSTSSINYCFTSRTLTSSTERTCMEQDHVKDIVRNLPAEVHFVFCSTKFRQSGYRQTVERGCDVRLAPVNDTCDDATGYCTCNSDKCNREDWSDISWQPGRDPIPPVVNVATSRSPYVYSTTSGSYVASSKTPWNHTSRPDTASPASIISGKIVHNFNLYEYGFIFISIHNHELKLS